MTAEGAPGWGRQGRVAASTLVTSVAQAAAMLGGGVLAALAGWKYGSGSNTDGFFAAYAVYALVVMLAQASRTSIVARLTGGEGDEFGEFNRFCGAALLLFGVSGVLFVALGDEVAALMTGDLPDTAQDVERRALLILWPAGGAQLFAALGAAMLARRDDYGHAAVGFGGGAVLSIAAFLVLEPSLGIDALPTGIVAASAFTAAAVAAGLYRAGWRPVARPLLDVRGAAARARLIVLASLALLLSQIASVVAVAVAGQMGEGAVTVYSYAFFAVGVAVGVLASSVAITLAAPIAAEWDRDPRTLRPHQRDVVRTGLVLLVPIVAAAALLGTDLGEALLPKFGDDEIADTVACFLILAPTIVGAQVIAVPVVALYALGRYRALALMSAATVALHIALAIAIAGTDDVRLLAATATVSGAVSNVIIIALLHGRGGGRVLADLALDAGAVVALAAVAFVPAALVLHGLGTGGDALAFAAGLVLFALGARLALPHHWELMVRLARVLRPPRATAPAA
jgi:peptidoglycan biosynthesis protein MviN/MurJ (putative lipid II flippase)